MTGREMASMFLFSKGVKADISPSDVNFFSIPYNTIFLHAHVYFGHDANSYLIALHEAAHAVQSKRLKGLLFIIVMLPLGRVLLEMDATKQACHYLAMQGEIFTAHILNVELIEYCMNASNRLFFVSLLMLLFL